MNRNKQNRHTDALKSNLDAAQQLWNGKLGPLHLEQLKVLGEKYSFSVHNGDLLLVDNRWYVSHTGLLRLATKKRCSGIHVRAVPEFCDPVNCRWAFEATVYKSRTCKGFVGFGDADLNNTSSLVRGAEMRVAETRAVNRALRKAYGIGICSIEEVGATPRPTEPPAQVVKFPAQTDSAPVNGNGHLLRDQIQLLIRRHKLDASLVKLYAADFCGTEELRQASREQVEKFAKHLAEYAESDRDGLQCQLNSYAPKEKENEKGRGGGMKRQIAGLSHATQSNDEPADGEYLVRIVRAQYRWDKSKPYYIIRFEIIEPATSAHKDVQRTNLLQRQGSVETELVSPGFRLRP